MIGFAACIGYLLLRFVVYGAKYMYVVAVASIVTELHAHHNFVEISYLFLELGSFISIIFTSPFSDFRSRRALIVIYFILAIVGSLIISSTQSAWLFYLARFIEGLGLGNLFSIGNALVYDAFAKNDKKNSIITSRVFSSLGVFSSFFIVLNLLLFASLAKHFNWRELFFILSVLIAVTGIAVFVLLTFFTESKKIEKVITLRVIGKEYWHIIANFKALCYTLVFSLSKAANALLYLLLTFILMSKGYDAINAALYLTPLAVANIVGKQLNVVLGNYHIKPRFILFFSSLIQFLPMAFVFVIAVINAQLLTSWLLIMVCALMTIGTGILSPLSNSRLMALYPDKPNMANNMLTLFTGFWAILFIFLADLVNAARPVPFIMLILLLTTVTLVFGSVFLVFHKYFDNPQSVA